MQDKKNHEIHFFIDKQRFETTEEALTVRALLVDFAHENPTQTTLVLRHGHETHKFTNLDEVVRLENGMHFVVYHDGPTPVS